VTSVESIRASICLLLAGSADAGLLWRLAVFISLVRWRSHFVCVSSATILASVCCCLLCFCLLPIVFVSCSVTWVAFGGGGD
jgi:hypothetical protein